ncbi:FTR1 family iron permease [Metabacillus fastidiosus]|uniref:FTR1 family iron permease n=1 Tax=Metabacillus fastidiosus TaxID=1458 RepID=UPI003D27B3C6
MKRISALSFAIFLIFNLLVIPPALGAENLDDLYIEIGDALMKAKAGDQNAVKEHVANFQHGWEKIEKENSKQADKVDKTLKQLNEQLAKEDSVHVTELLSALSKGLVLYEKEQSPVNDKQEKEKIKQLLPLVTNIENEVNAGNFDEAERKFGQFLTKWTENETVVRTQSIASYGEIETGVAFVRIALAETPPTKEKALSSINQLKIAFDHFLTGKAVKQTSGNYKLEDVIQLLEKSDEALADNKADEAMENLNKILLIWPAVEGEVRTKDQALYNRMENEVPKAISLISSDHKELDKADTIVADLYKDLKLIAGKTNYSFVDSFLILFREGIEALVIIAGLVAFLRKTNNGDKQVWVWSGVVGGMAASAVLAVCINLFFSQVTAATSREYLEGIIGLIAVIMMFTVGAWLHTKTNIHHWNHFMNENLNKAIAKGSLFSIATLSFLSIFREGAETIIFYAGLAPLMSVKELILGIGIAIIILAVFGFVIIRYSTKIALRPFFIIAAWFIYVLAFKMIGVSVHALQVANTIPIHHFQAIPYIEMIGLYPTAETIIPQLVLIMLVFGTTVYAKRIVKNIRKVRTN